MIIRNESVILCVADDDSGYATVDRELRCYAPREVIKQATEDQLNEIAQHVRAFYFSNGTVSRSTLKGYVNVSVSLRVFLFMPVIFI